MINGKNNWDEHLYNEKYKSQEGMSHLMVTQYCHLPVGPVVAEHLGRHIVTGVGELVQLLLQSEGRIVCPENRFIRCVDHNIIEE